MEALRFSKSVLDCRLKIFKSDGTYLEDTDIVTFVNVFKANASAITLTAYNKKKLT